MAKSGGNDPSAANDMENVEDTYDRGNVELLKNVGNLDNKEFVENSKNEENLENVVNRENPENVGNMDNPVNVENIKSQESVENMENVDILENPVPVEKAVNMENPENVQNAENMKNQVNVENVENMENTVGVDNVENLVRVTAVREESQQENFQGTENNSEVKEENLWPGWPGVNVFRMLVPVQRVGSLIGHKGEIIKKICDETKSSIKILDGPVGESERTLLVSAKEEPQLPISPAMDGLLTIHKHIIDEDRVPDNVVSGGIVCTKILVPPSQAGFLIGKQGSTIKSIKDTSNCNICVLQGENLPVSAFPDDRVIRVQGESSGVHKAVELILSQLRKFLVDHGVVEVFQKQMQKPNACAQIIPPFQHWGGPQGFPVAGAGPISIYIPSPQKMLPSRPFGTYYPPGESLPMDKQPRRGPFSHGRDHSHLSHGRDHSMEGHVRNGQPHQSILVTKVTLKMHIPISYVDTVIGTAGSNISYIRRSSGATISVQETIGDPVEMTLQLTGSESQVQVAYQLIQTLMTEAVNNAQNAVGGPPVKGPNGHASHAPSGSNYGI